MKPSNRVPITPEIIATLKTHQIRTGVPPHRLLGHANEDEVPKGLNDGIISSWLNGKTKTAKADFLDFTIQLWSLLPQGPPTNITLGFIKTLKAHIRRTGIGPMQLLEHVEAKHTPFDLSGLIIDAWLSGKLLIADRGHLAFVFSAWTGLPDNEFIPITRHNLNALRYHRERTGVDCRELFAGASNSVPKGFDTRMLNDVLLGKVIQMRRMYLKFALSEWEVLPDQSSPKPPKHS